MCQEKSGSKGATEVSTSNFIENINEFEDLLEVVGTSGKRNYFILFCCVWASVVSPLHTVSYQFLGAIPEHWCQVEPLKQNNWTDEQIKNISLPEYDASGKGQFCEKINYNYEDVAQLGFTDVLLDGELLRVNGTHNSTSCLSREFEDTPITISMEWDLVCDRKWIYSFTQTAVMIGKLVGSFTLGYLFDMYGRKRVLLWSSPMYIIVGLLTSASPHVSMYIICKVLSSALGMSFYMGGLVLAMEICSPKQRSYVGTYSALPWAIGYMLVPLISYLVQPWRWMQVALTMPAFTQFAFLWFVPESPRWLMLQQRYEESYSVLEEMARGNDRKLPSKEEVVATLKDLHDKDKDRKDKNGGEQSLFMKLTAIVRLRSLRTTSFACFFCWFSASLVYYGVSLNSSNLSTNKYIYTFLGGLTEVPSYLLLAPLIAKFGRTKILVASYWVCSTCIFIVMVLILTDYDDISSLMIVLSLIGKFAITATFQLIWMFTAELFPTEYRSIALGESSTCARFGSGLSPFINDMLGDKEASKWAPSAFFAVMSLLAGIVSAILPDTNNKTLADLSKQGGDDTSKTGNTGMEMENIPKTTSREVYQDTSKIGIENESYSKDN